MPDIHKNADLNANWLVYSDGGCRKQGASAYAWLVYATIEVAGKWHLFQVAFGCQWISEDQSAFLVEAQGLEKALDCLSNLVAI